MKTKRELLYPEDLGCTTEEFLKYRDSIPDGAVDVSAVEDLEGFDSLSEEHQERLRECERLERKSELAVSHFLEGS